VGHEAEIRGLSFSPDGRLLASTDLSSVGLVWDLTAPGGNGRPPAGRMSDKDLEGYWTDLADKDGGRAYRSILRLAASPDQAVRLLHDRLKPIEAADSERMTHLLTDLDDKDFARREQATRELEKLGLNAEASLRRALLGKPSSEVRRRVEQLLNGLEAGPMLRLIRALEVLENIATPESQEILETIAKGAAEARLTQEAKASLQRLQKRTRTTN
jgi:hypothetical protein